MMIRATKVRLYIRLMRTRGHGPDAVLEGTRIDSGRLSDPDYLIEQWQEKRVIANVLGLTHSQPLAPLLADQLELSDFGILGHTLTTCKTLSEAAGLWRRYSPLLFGQLVSIRLRRVRHTLQVELTELMPLGPLLRFSIEENLVFGKFIGETLLRQPFVFTDLSLSFPAPDARGIYGDLFGCRVRFNTGVNRITMTAPSCIEAPEQEESELHQLCLRKCEQVVAQVDTGTPWSSRVRVLLFRGNTLPRIEEAAEALHVSDRSLRRHLCNEGTSFRQIVNDYRFAMAREYLGASGLSNQEIGFLLGYRDTKAFFRAFREWSGCTVNTYRKRILAAC